MLISFFEEFPTKKNLAKLKYVRWPTKLYLAAQSLKEFQRIAKAVRNKNVECVYWPILRKDEGYWFSGFAKRSGMRRVFDELHEHSVPVMIDAEFPATLSLYLTQLPSFLGNTLLLRRFVYHHSNVSVCSYPLTRWDKRLLSFFGLYFPPSVYGCTVMSMLYHSMMPYTDSFLEKSLEHGKKEFSDRFVVGFGTIAKGVLGSEPILSVQQLENDLKIAKKVGMKEVVIFRLGGLTPNYAKMLSSFV